MKYLSRTLMLVLLLSGAWLLWTGELQIIQADISRPATSAESSQWYNLTNLSTNAFHSWKSDALLLRIEGMFYGQSIGPDQPPWIISLVLFFLGTTWFFTSLRREGGIAAASLNSAALTVVLTLLFGADRVVFGGLVFMPWCILFIRRLLSDSRDLLPFTIVSLFLVMRLAAGANQLAPLYLFAALLISVSMTREPRERGRTYFPLLGVLLLLGAALSPLFAAPAPDYPDYPALARVAPFSGVADFVRPLAGMAGSIQVINRGAVQNFAGTPSLVLCLLSIFPLLIYRNSASRKMSRAAFAASALFAFSAVLDSLPPEQISQIMPLASLSRIVPGLFLIPLAPACIALAVFFLAAGFHAARADTVAALLTGLVILIPGASLQLPGVQISNPQFFSFLVSPSSQIIRNEGEWILKRREEIEALKSRGIRRLVADIASSTGEDRQKLLRISDGRLHTRWSPQKGRQDGGTSEWLALRFDQTVNVAGLEISPGDFRTDFPRGLEIKTSPVCSSLSENEDSLLTVFKQNPWQGALKFTPSGYPYYGAQSEVKLYFRELIPVQCLKISQIGQTPDFDWSVARIRLLVPEVGASLGNENEEE